MNLVGKYVYVQLQKGLGETPIFQVGGRHSDLIRAAVVAENDHGLGIALETVQPFDEPEEFDAPELRPEYRGVAFIPWANIQVVFELEGGVRAGHRVWKMPAALRP